MGESAFAEAWEYAIIKAAGIRRQATGKISELQDCKTKIDYENKKNTDS
jgi:hypothetical protein